MTHIFGGERPAIHPGFGQFILCLLDFRVEREHVEKLHRELAFQEELVFAVGEVIASAQYRIKDKSELRDRLIRLQSIEKS